MFFQITDALTKLQIPIMAIYVFYVAWVGHLGWEIESIDGPMASFESTLAGIWAYPSLAGLAIGVGLSWVVFVIWGRRRTADADPEA